MKNEDNTVRIEIYKMKFLVNRQIRKAIKLFGSWKIEEADALLSDLEKRHPNNDKIKFHYGRTQNSLGYRERALELLEECINLNPRNEDALFIMVPVLLELADIYEEENLGNLKERFLLLSKRSFENIGLDLATVYMYLAKIAKNEGNYNNAIHYISWQRIFI